PELVQCPGCTTCLLASLSSEQAPLAAGSSTRFISHNKGDLCGPGEHPVVLPPGLIPWDDQNSNRGVVQQISSALVQESDTLIPLTWCRNRG
ncbi:unnamed protein product, partial [Ectocarpus sp. 13 AM-2016]